MKAGVHENHWRDRQSEKALGITKELTRNAGGLAAPLDSASTVNGYRGGGRWKTWAHVEGKKLVLEQGTGECDR